MLAIAHRALVLLLILGIAVAGSGCARARLRKHLDPVGAVLIAARGMEGGRRVAVRGEERRADCSGFVCACFEAAGVEIMDPEQPGVSATERIWRTMVERGQTVPDRALRPGDVVVFDDTYDRNRNRRPDDPFSHVALIESADPDGTLTYLHYGSRGVARGSMNLRHPGVERDPDTGRTWNSVLGTVGRKVLAGQLFRGGGRPIP